MVVVLVVVKGGTREDRGGQVLECSVKGFGRGNGVTLLLV